MLLDEVGREVIVLSESGERDCFFSRENACFFIFSEMRRQGTQMDPGAL